MLEEMLSDEDDASLDDYYTVRSFWPLVQAHDGQPMAREWMFARALLTVAHLTLERERALAEVTTPAQQQLLAALAEVRQHEPLARRDGLVHPVVPGDWFKLPACLARGLPLVERLLLR